MYELRFLWKQVVLKIVRYQTTWGLRGHNQPLNQVKKQIMNNQWRWNSIGVMRSNRLQSVLNLSHSAPTEVFDHFLEMALQWCIVVIQPAYNQGIYNNDLIQLFQKRVQLASQQNPQPPQPPDGPRTANLVVKGERSLCNWIDCTANSGFCHWLKEWVVSIQWPTI